MKRIYIYLLIITVIGAVFRLYQLGSIPISLNWDEVSWGYNAYSMLQTGKDEYGETLPLSFRAFNDFKQPVYVYIETVPIAIFGLTPLAVRLPSAVFGILTIPAIFFLTRQVFDRHKKKEWIALITALSFAISPWSIQFSRVAFEANVALFFTVTGAYLFIKGAHKKDIKILLLALIVISISSFTYHSAKIFTPLLVLVLFLTYFRYFWANKKVLVALSIIYLLLNSLWILDMRTTARGRSVMFTSNQTEILKPHLTYLAEKDLTPLPINKTLFNRRIIYIKKYAQNYLSNFDPNYLFVKGDNARHHAPGMGVMYITLIPIIIIGLIALAKYKEKEKWIIIFWLLASPLAAALAVDSPNASRALVMLPPWEIAVGLGATTLILILRNHRLVLLAIAGVIALNVMYFASQYFMTTNIKTAPYWQDGYKEAVEYAINNTDKNIYFSNKLEQPYIFYLFYKKYDPSAYQASGGSYRTQDKCYKIDNISFGDCPLPESDFVYIVGSQEEYNQGGSLEKTITHPDGAEAILIYNNTQKN